jgi:hypothetical protein
MRDWHAPSIRRYFFLTQFRIQNNFRPFASKFQKPRDANH